MTADDRPVGVAAGSLDRSTAPLVVELGHDTLAADHDPGALLGGKGASLAELIDADFPVPGTGVVTTSAYRAAALDRTVERLLSGDDNRAPTQVTPTPRGPAPTSANSSTDPTAEEVDAAFQRLHLEPDLADSIVDLARRVGSGDPIAVRSSATVEDLHGSSFAGQYRSLLNVDSTDSDAVLTAVRAVWASLWHPAPTAYRRAFGIADDEIAMAVVLMRMIPADTAGVVFTLDPGGTSGARVEAVEGLGESLVSGRAKPEAWVIPLGPETDARAGLPTAASAALDLALAVEDRTGVPQDVEWAAVDDQVYVVQARPITVLEDHDGFDTVIDQHELTTAGIVEMVPGVLPALRWETNRFLLEEAFRSVLDSLGIIRGTAAEDRPFVRRVRGRVAVDFDQLRDAAAGIPGAVRNLETQYFGVADDDGDDESPSSSPYRFRWSGLRRDLNTLQTRRKVIDQAEVLIRATDALDHRRPELERWSADELVAYLRRLVDLSARGLAAELGVAAAGAATFQRLETQLSKHLGPDEGPRAAQTVTARAGAVVERRPSASAAIFAGPTWDELGTTPSVPPNRMDGSTADDDTAWGDLRHRLRSLPGWTRRRILTGGVVDIRMHLIRRLVDDVVEQLHRREAAKAALLDLGGEVRRVLLELGRRLAERGDLEAPADIELLTSRELRAAFSNEQGVPPDALRRRRNWLTRYEAEGSLPNRFRGQPDRTPAPLPEGDVLDGWAASPGRRRGRAQVVRSATGSIEPEAVLVAETTDASWSPLFLKAGAVVVERGGPLSHAAILARELGLPAVLNVEGATSLLDGRIVSVDGDQGIVVIETGAHAP